MSYDIDPAVVRSVRARAAHLIQERLPLIMDTEAVAAAAERAADHAEARLRWSHEASATDVLGGLTAAETNLRKFLNERWDEIVATGSPTRAALTAGDADAALAAALRQSAMEVSSRHGRNAAEILYTGALAEGAPRACGDWEAQERWMAERAVGDPALQAATREIGPERCAAVQTWLNETWAEVEKAARTLLNAERIGVWGVTAELEGAEK